MGKGVSKISPQRAVINWDDLTKLCQMQCTAEEAASFLGVHLATLIRAIKREHGQTFKEYFAQHAPSGKASLRRAQLQLAALRGWGMTDNTRKNGANTLVS